jgi:hypothetical protein
MLITEDDIHIAHPQVPGFYGQQEDDKKGGDKDKQIK